MDENPAFLSEFAQRWHALKVALRVEKQEHAKEETKRLEAEAAASSANNDTPRSKEDPNDWKRGRNRGRSEAGSWFARKVWEFDTSWPSTENKYGNRQLPAFKTKKESKKKGPNHRS